MLRRFATAGVLFAAATAGPALAQQAGNVAEIHFNQAKPGMTQQYEAGRKKHMAWHKAQNDAWSWYTWQVLTGDATGSYVVGTFSRQWKDFDPREKFNEADGVDAEASFGAAQANARMSYYIYRADLSLSPEATTPAPMAVITHFMLTQDGVNDFVEAVKQVNAAIKKTNYPQAGASRWYQLANGGDGPHFVLVGDRANWAAFQPPTDKTLDAMMEEAYGKEPGAAILAKVRKTFHSISTETLRYRPDLSYVAGK
jgi:hypothetical protein